MLLISLFSCSPFRQKFMPSVFFPQKSKKTADNTTLIIFCAHEFKSAWEYFSPTAWCAPKMTLLMALISHHYDMIARFKSWNIVLIRKLYLYITHTYHVSSRYLISPLKNKVDQLSSSSRCAAQGFVFYNLIFIIHPHNNFIFSKSKKKLKQVVVNSQAWLMMLFVCSTARRKYSGIKGEEIYYFIISTLL